jgi:hypothetical protein
VAVSGSRCCGGECNGRTRTPSVSRAPDSAAKRRLSTLSAVCVLGLAAHVATARAEDVPQPPVIPTVPTVAVQVSVSIPSVSVAVQTGTVDISVSTASVDVSVSVSSADTAAGTDAADAARQQTTQDDGSGNCCEGDAKEVASPPPSAKATRAAPPAKRPDRPTIRAAAIGVRTRTTRVPLVDPSKRSLAAKQVPRLTSERPATRPKARRGCCDGAQARVVIAAAARGLRPRPRAGPRPYRYEGAQVRPVAALPEEHARDNRLLLQLGVLGAFLYLVCLAGWFSATTLRRRRA